MVLDHRGLSVSLGGEPIRSPYKFGKLIGYFEKLLVHPKPEIYDPRGTKKSSLSLSL